MVGEKFLLCCEGTALRVYRMDDGTLAAESTAFLNEYKCVCLSEGHVVAHSIQSSSCGIVVEQPWKKALPARFSADLVSGAIMAGEKFLLCCEGTALRVYRMDDGTLATESTAFLNDSCGIIVEQLWKKALPARFSADLVSGAIMVGEKFLLCCEGTALRVYRMDDGTLAAESTAFLNEYKCVCLSEGHVVAHSIQSSSCGIVVEQLWKKALPARFSADLGSGAIMAGEKFLLCCEGTALRVYRMDDGTLATESTAFLNT
ncbi:hypothetical protein ACOMHN_004189 [Nucella lapillus]